MVPQAWAHLPFFTRDWPRIRAAVAADGRPCLPPEPQRFAALELVSPAMVRVVILGQDPYPTPGHAHGLAFSVEPDVTPLPRSLKNIFKELADDLNLSLPNGDLRGWANQGVLLLNTCLTVPAREPMAHGKLGWHRLAEEVIGAVSTHPCAFVLWGAHAQGLKPAIRPGAHLIIESAHPSPLSARRGFFGSRPFSRINEWLAEHGNPPIDWAARA